MENINKWINKIHQGNTLDLLKQMPDNFVDTIVTSPPYWGLRDYGSETNTIWDGDPNCKHEWGYQIGKKYGGGTDNTFGQFKDEHTHFVQKYGFCKKCGAWYGQLGLEPTVNLYIDHMLQITSELKRVLKPTGAIFWNHGDCYGGSGMGAWKNPPDVIKSKEVYHIPYESNVEVRKKREMAKCLMLQNYRLILKMIDQQSWILRNQIVWYKRNAMPSSVTDRLSNKWEPVFVLVKNNKPVYYYNTKTGLMVDKKPPKEKQREGIDWGWEDIGEEYSESITKIPPEDAEKLSSPRARVYRKKERKKVSYWRSLDYFFDLDAIRVPYTEKLNRWGGERLIAKGKSSWDEETGQKTYRDRDMRPNKDGKNPGDMFNIPTQPFSGAHFAVFPKKLIIPMIKDSCPQWICKKCGKPRVRITKVKEKICRQWGERKSKPWFNDKREMPQKKIYESIRETIGWTDCQHNDGWTSGIVLDPFCGSGTTAVVAKELGRNFIGLEINPEYIAMAKERLTHVAPRIDKWTDNVTISNGMSKWKI